MSEYAKKRVEMEFRSFTTSWKRPADCKDASQIRFYIEELSKKIEVYETEFQHVPSWIYALISQYNHAHNRVVHRNFVNDYA